MTRTLQLILAAFVAVAISVPASAAAQGSLTVDKNLAKRGKKLYETRGCGSCHAFGKQLSGPDLVGATERRDLDWLKRWLKAPDEMLASDSLAMAMLDEYKGVKMPNLRLTDADVDALLHYMQQESDKKK
jgi:protein SCO1